MDSYFEISRFGSLKCRVEKIKTSYELVSEVTVHHKQIAKTPNLLISDGVYYRFYNYDKKESGIRYVKSCANFLGRHIEYYHGKSECRAVQNFTKVVKLTKVRYKNSIIVLVNYYHVEAKPEEDPADWICGLDPVYKFIRYYGNLTDLELFQQIVKELTKSSNFASIQNPQPSELLEYALITINPFHLKFLSIPKNGQFYHLINDRIYGSRFVCLDIHGLWYNMYYNTFETHGLNHPYMSTASARFKEEHSISFRQGKDCPVLFTEYRLEIKEDWKTHHVILSFRYKSTLGDCKNITIEDVDQVTCRVFYRASDLTVKEAERAILEFLGKIINTPEPLIINEPNSTCEECSN